VGGPGLGCSRQRRHGEGIPNGKFIAKHRWSPYPQGPLAPVEQECRCATLALWARSKGGTMELTEAQWQTIIRHTIAANYPRPSTKIAPDVVTLTRVYHHSGVGPIGDHFQDFTPLKIEIGFGQSPESIGIETMFDD
jgi:hypothetical protein